MTSEETAAVAAALEGEDSLSISAAVGRLFTAEQLHQFALNYNPNDGLLPCLAVVQHPLCDAGTALHIYWNFSELVFDAALRDRSAKKDANWNGDSILSAVERKVKLASFASSRYSFDAETALGLNDLGRRALKLLNLQRELLHCEGDGSPAREWLP